VPVATICTDEFGTLARTEAANLGMAGLPIVFVPHPLGGLKPAQVEAKADAVVDGVQQTWQVFSMRSMASGGAFHCAFPHASQQAFLEGHERAFAYFGGVFGHCRYDNLKSAVKKILRGHQREETTRFIAFRSHWGFESEFCTPGEGHEKGGVEGEAGQSAAEMAQFVAGRPVTSSTPSVCLS